MFHGEPLSVMQRATHIHATGLHQMKRHQGPTTAEVRACLHTELHGLQALDSQHPKHQDFLKRVRRWLVCCPPCPPSAQRAGRPSFPPRRWCFRAFRGWAHSVPDILLSLRAGGGCWALKGWVRSLPGRPAGSYYDTGPHRAHGTQELGDEGISPAYSLYY